MLIGRVMALKYAHCRITTYFFDSDDANFSVHRENSMTIYDSNDRASNVENF